MNRRPRQQKRAGTDLRPPRKPAGDEIGDAEAIAKAVEEIGNSTRRTAHPGAGVPASSASRVIVSTVGLVMFVPSVVLLLASFASDDGPSASFYVFFLFMAAASGWMVWASVFGKDSTVRGMMDGL